MTATPAQVAHYQAMARLAQGYRRVRFDSHWLETEVIVDYEVEQCETDAGRRYGRVNVAEIYIGGAPLWQFFTDSTVRHVQEELERHLETTNPSELIE